MFVVSDFATSLCFLIIVSISSVNSLLDTQHKHETNVTANTTSSTSTRPPQSTTPMTMDLLMKNLVDQFNDYRHIEILVRIRQCHSNMQLNDLCERYSVDQRTYSLERVSVTQFRSLDHLTDTLIDRAIVEKLTKLCSPARWCLGDLPPNAVNLTISLIQQHARSLCSLDQCRPRLLTFTNTCPSLTNKNVSIPTLKLLPLFCTLDQRRQDWNQSACMESLVYVLHLLYAFWPELEICYRNVIHGSNACSPSCQAFDDIFHRMEGQCDDHASFLSQVPTIAWYRSIDLKQLCAGQSISSRPALISSMQTFFTSNTIWHQFQKKPVYAASLILILACLVVSLSLCFYLKSKQRRLNTANRRLHDDYEYTRLHNTSFELGTSTAISNMSDRLTDDAQMDTVDPHLSIAEYQRLLHLES